MQHSRRGFDAGDAAVSAGEGMRMHERQLLQASLCARTELRKRSTNTLSKEHRRGWRHWGLFPIGHGCYSAGARSASRKEAWSTGCESSCATRIFDRALEPFHDDDGESARTQ